MRILVVEDDIKIANFIKKGLQEESYSVDVTHHGDEAIYLAQVNPYDIILLDLMLPGSDGMDVCKSLRTKDVSTPIIMLTARSKLEDKIDGLDSGADDYLTKPFAFEELLARIRAQLRNKSQSSAIIKVGDLTIDTNKREVRRAENKIVLTVKEYALLELLARNAKKLLSETIIKDNLSDMAQETMSNIINVYIYRLRNKIDKGFEAKLLHTVRGTGYMLSDEDV
ncbi:response regulator transcription factor [Sulfurimonas lithotrophica]|mgnify:CR=1 FL=1|uniref:Response regulator transcription factor n=1 Tax=Sulfurimonas lithotrophica TaxID=2590022 RepID=A0A5P8P2U3_9BACT|nr:response regulator transcription factor [Sulfurimonas lithotrophica]QFR49917.1 response regulator transcription factor [Sulfurimonas lithotrophica]